MTTQSIRRSWSGGGGRLLKVPNASGKAASWKSFCLFIFVDMIVGGVVMFEAYNKSVPLSVCVCVSLSVCVLV